MSGWTRRDGEAATLPIDNIDTDRLIPARFMSAPRSVGYGQFLLHDLRFDECGEATDIALHEGASVLIAGRNFGCGSSREAAVYALADFGVWAVLAPSFGDIFAANAVNNGLLPARVNEEAIARFVREVESGATAASVSLEECAVSVGAASGEFEIDPVWRRKLMNGWDDIDLTAELSEEIAAYRAANVTGSPWLTPRRAEE